MADPYTCIPEEGVNNGRIVAENEKLFQKLRERLNADGVRYTIEPTTYTAAKSSGTLPAFVFQGVFSMGQRSAALAHDFRVFDVWGVVEAGTLVTDTVANQTYRVGKQNENGFSPLYNVTDGENTAFESMDPIDHERWREGSL